MDRYQVELADFPGDRIVFVKALRIVGKVSLLDATHIYVHASNAKGTVLAAGIDKQVADHIAATFIDVGMKVLVKPSSIKTPMICRPQANSAYQWGALRSLVPV